MELVVDEATSTLYAAQEDIGLWRVQLVRAGSSASHAASNAPRASGVPATYDESGEERTSTNFRYVDATFLTR